MITSCFLLLSHRVSLCTGLTAGGELIRIIRIYFKESLCPQLWQTGKYATSKSLLQIFNAQLGFIRRFLAGRFGNAAMVIDSVIANGGEIVQPLGADAPEITARFRDPAGNIIGLYQEAAR